MHRPHCTLLGSFIAAVTFLTCNALGFELALPPSGTDINYSFHTEVPIFTITDFAPTAEVLERRLTFTEDRELHIYNEHEDFLFVVYLTLRSPDILDSFDEILPGFDESLTLLDKNGMVLAVETNNSSIGYNPNLRDTYEYA